METRQRQASAGAKTRQDKLERLGLGQAAKKEGQPAAGEEGEVGGE
jgi:hypothetical protein